MKKYFYFLFFIAFAQSQAQIRAYFSHSAFTTPENKPYLETYLTVFGNSVSFKKNNHGKFQGDIEVGIIFSQNGVIKATRKYNLQSPEITDTLHEPNFIDVQRFSLDEGEYDFEMTIADKNLNGKIYPVKDKIKISFPQSQVEISDVELLDSYKKSEKKDMLSKSGFDLVPYNADFFPENIKEFSFYAEIYNTKKILGENEKFLLNYFIEKYENNSLLPSYSAMKKEIAAPVTILLSQFNIQDLPSGNYNLVVQVKNKNNELVAFKKVFFQRKNIKAKVNLTDDLANVQIENTFAAYIHGKDTISEFIRALRPIASQSEKTFIDNQLKLADVKLMQQFFYNFWQSRNAAEPESAWKKYYQDVRSVNAKFGSFIYKGYNTDRGRVYLQYGPPDKREEFPHEPNAFPYEIWVYYTLEDKSKLNPKQTNRQFVFYNTEFATGNYMLLHSDALSELHDVNWEMKLRSRTVQSNDMEMLTPPPSYGGNAHDEFHNPK